MEFAQLIKYQSLRGCEQQLQYQLPDFLGYIKVILLGFVLGIFTGFVAGAVVLWIL